MMKLASLSSEERHILTWALDGKAVVVNPEVGRDLKSPIDLDSPLLSRATHASRGDFLPLQPGEFNPHRLQHFVDVVPEEREVSPHVQLRENRIVLKEPWRPYVEALIRPQSVKRRFLFWLYRTLFSNKS